MFLPTKELEAVTSRLSQKCGAEVPFEQVMTIVKAHRGSRKLARKLLPILQAELDKAWLDPGHEAASIDIKMHLEGDEIRVVEQVLGLFYPAYDFTSLGGHDASAIEKANAGLRRDGVMVLDKPLAADRVAALIDVLRNPKHAFAEKGTGTIHQGYDPERAEQADANTVWLVDQDRLNQEPLVQALAFDPYVLSVAQAYLGAPPIHVQTNAWWSLNHADDRKALAASAQKYHQDKEFVKFIKLFVYLTDVGPENGPHQYIKGSIHDYGRATPRRYKFGKRLEETKVEKAFGPERVMTMTGQAGSMILEDTHGLHRGVPVRSGHRLLLQFEYANSLFCSPVPRFKGAGVAAFEKHGDEFPRLFANYD